MLVHLHVKNLALIEEIEVEFGPGLNILTGETGAGKSILLGAAAFLGAVLFAVGFFSSAMVHPPIIPCFSIDLHLIPPS